MARILVVYSLVRIGQGHMSASGLLPVIQVTGATQQLASARTSMSAWDPAVDTQRTKAALKLRQTEAQ